jgi:hypothetical protein
MVIEFFGFSNNAYYVVCGVYLMVKSIHPSMYNG